MTTARLRGRSPPFIRNNGWKWNIKSDPPRCAFHISHGPLSEVSVGWLGSLRFKLHLISDSVIASMLPPSSSPSHKCPNRPSATTLPTACSATGKSARELEIVNNTVGRPIGAQCCQCQWAPPRHFCDRSSPTNNLQKSKWPAYLEGRECLSHQERS